MNDGRVAEKKIGGPFDVIAFDPAAPNGLPADIFASYP